MKDQSLRVPSPKPTQTGGSGPPGRLRGVGLVRMS